MHIKWIQIAGVALKIQMLFVSSYSICDKSPSLFCCRRVLFLSISRSLELLLSTFYCRCRSYLFVRSLACLLACSFIRLFICSSRFFLFVPYFCHCRQWRRRRRRCCCCCGCRCSLLAFAFTWLLHTVHIERPFVVIVVCVLLSKLSAKRKKTDCLFLLLLISYRYNVLDVCVRACVHACVRAFVQFVYFLFIHWCARIDFVICDLYTHSDDIVNQINKNEQRMYVCFVSIIYSVCLYNFCIYECAIVRGCCFEFIELIRDSIIRDYYTICCAIVVIMC